MDRSVGVLRTSAYANDRQLSKQDRERLLEPFLPKPRLRSAPNGVDHDIGTPAKTPESRLVTFLTLLCYGACFRLIQFAFGLYINCRQIYHFVLHQALAIVYYHHRTPELIQRDIKGLSRLPQHLSVVVDLESSDGDVVHAEAIARLLNDVADIAVWSSAAGIPVLSVYERTGVLKKHVASLHRSILRVLRTYYPPGATPSVRVHAPHHSSQTWDSTKLKRNSAVTRPLDILLLSGSDGRETLVDLTKTLVEMSQRGKLSPSDISADLIDAELSASCCGEPELLILMAPSAYQARNLGRTRKLANDMPKSMIEYEPERLQLDLLGPGGEICLRGYPPWQVRLTEIFYVQDGTGVDYQIFLRALYRYAKAEMRFGR